MATTNQLPTVEETARRRAQNLTGLLWHTGVFVIINAFFIVLDASGQTGVNWSIVVIVCWGLGLAFHALWYFIDGRGLEDRKTRQYLDEERGEAS